MSVFSPLRREYAEGANPSGIFSMTRIAPPHWATQPDLNVFRISVAEYRPIQQHRGALLEVVQREIDSYLNDPARYVDGAQDGFPNRSRMTGAYYIAYESYHAHRDPSWFQIGAICHCLQYPAFGMPRKDTYLGLEVWLRCEPDKWSKFEIFRNTDSSFI